MSGHARCVGTSSSSCGPSARCCSPAATAPTEITPTSHDRSAGRVLIVTNGLTYGGAETQTVHLACGLVQRGYDVRLLSILPTRAHAQRLAAHDILVAHVRLGGRLPDAAVSIRDGVRALRDWPCDVLISFVYQANVLGRIAGTITGTPVIISSIRNQQFGGAQRERLIRATDRLASVTTTNSAIVAESLIDRGIVPAQRLTVIPNAVDTDRFRPGTTEERRAGRAALGLADGVFGWLAIGRLQAQKAWPVLIRAARSLPADQQVLIVGEGPDREALEQLIAEHDLADRVRLLGHREDVDVLMRGGDALVLSSAWEGLPNVIAEAMATGLPVVATDVGGVRELVDEGRTGTVVAPADPVALASAMRALVAAEPAARAAMGRRARSTILQGFARESVLDRWVDLIGEQRLRATRGSEHGVGRGPITGGPDQMEIAR